MKPKQGPDDEPPVMGAGDGPAAMPTRDEAEAAWRQFYAERMVERGFDQESAQAAAEAAEVDLSENPGDAADDEISYWDADDDLLV